MKQKYLFVNQYKLKGYIKKNACKEFFPTDIFLIYYLAYTLDIAAKNSLTHGDGFVECKIPNGIV